VLEVDLDRSIPPAHVDSQIRSYALQRSRASLRTHSSGDHPADAVGPILDARLGGAKQIRYRRGPDRLLLNLL
jgi:hypothetical protein